MTTDPGSPEGPADPEGQELGDPEEDPDGDDENVSTTYNPDDLESVPDDGVHPGSSV